QDQQISQGSRKHHDVKNFVFRKSAPRLCGYGECSPFIVMLDGERFHSERSSRGLGGFPVEQTKCRWGSVRQRASILDSVTLAATDYSIRCEVRRRDDQDLRFRFESMF